MWYIALIMAAIALVMFIAGTLIIKYAEIKLQENQKEQVIILRDYAFCLGIYKEILIKMKDEGVDISKIPDWRS